MDKYVLANFNWIGNVYNGNLQYETNNFKSDRVYGIIKTIYVFSHLVSSASEQFDGSSKLSATDLFVAH